MKKAFVLFCSFLCLWLISGSAYADIEYVFQGTIAGDDFYVGSDYSDVSIGDPITIWTTWNDAQDTLVGFGFETGSISHSSNSNLTKGQGTPPGYVDHYSDNSVWLKLGTEVGNLSFDEGEFFAENPKGGPFTEAGHYNIVSLDVSQVPIPGVAWLLASGVGLIGLRRKSRH